MRYYIAKTTKDFLLCNECIASTGYYGPVALEDCGGFVLVAKDGDTVAGCVWATISGRIAIGDYLAIREGYTGLGVRLMVRLKEALLMLGVKQAKCFVYFDNTASLRILSALGATKDFPYALVSVSLEDSHG